MTIFNPLDKNHLGESVAKALLIRPCSPLPPAEPFAGAGIYAIYYTGNFPAYSAIAKLNADGQYNMPIYVGKAVPPGARRGGIGLGENPGIVLYRRIQEHSESIRKATNLDLDHFSCRYLVVDDIWIPLAEQLLIQKFHPLWNRVVDGFGNHPQGASRTTQRRSPWDTLHPGRGWAAGMPAQLTEQDIVEWIEKACDNLTTPDDGSPSPYLGDVNL